MPIWQRISRPSTTGSNEEVAFSEEKTEASVGVEPTMVDLQSTALATWLRRLLLFSYVIESKFDGQVG